MSGDGVSVQVEGDDGRQELRIGLSMLRQNWDRRQRTYLDSFIPFVAPALLRPLRTSNTPQIQRSCMLSRRSTTG